MPAVLFEVDPLLAPLEGADPCGPELDGSDTDFQALEAASAGKPERQYGDKIYPAEPPDWPLVFDLSLSLLKRSRDLRFAVWLARSGARLLGVPGAARGLQLVHGLLEQQWLHVHPKLDAEDHDDPTMRINALTGLSLGDAALADLRSAGIANRRGSLTVRELEVGLGKAEPHGGEARPTEAGVLQGLQALLQAEPQAADAVRDGLAASDAIIALLETKVGSAAPNLVPLRKLFTVVAKAVARVQPGADGTAAEAGSEAGDATTTAQASPAAAGASGALRSRADAVRELERICEWFERNEPGHPAPLLMRRAQRLMKMTFIEIIQDMAPHGFDQVQTIAGPQPE